MKLYRVEQLEYDYSPTLAIFDSLERAEQYLRDELKATVGLHNGGDSPIWGTGFGGTYFVVQCSTLNCPGGEERVLPVLPPER